MTIQHFIEAAQRDHAANPAAVAARLPDGFAMLLTAPDHAEAFARLVEHVVLGHMDDARELDRWIARLEPLAAGNSQLAAALARARLANALAGGAGMPAESSLTAADQVRAYGNALLALTRRAAWAEARARLSSAQALADAAGDAASLRSLAAITNNLAGDLRFYLGDHRDDGGYVDLMIDAARISHANWYRAGGWLERERADYQVALCLAGAGRAEEALRAAEACWQGCVENDADSVECFYALEALGHAHCAAGRLDEARAARVGMAERLPSLDEASRGPATEQLEALSDAITAREGRSGMPDRS
ncbi:MULTISPECIES: hypothetical protein [unclassified Inquilinus]|uniref:hypothetical protein n=1 Tax=unclassified Inquilinus TaxID=2645927 RepID=UPI003F90A9C1